jgi:hypothetical protein
MSKLNEEDLEKICDNYCKYPDICASQEMLDEKCITCPLAGVTDKKVEMGDITEEELSCWGFSNREKEIIKEQYRTHRKGFFPNPACALR